MFYSSGSFLSQVSVDEATGFSSGNTSGNSVLRGMALGARVYGGPRFSHVIPGAWSGF